MLAHVLGTSYPELPFPFVLRTLVTTDLRAHGRGAFACLLIPHEKTTLSCTDRNDLTRAVRSRRNLQIAYLNYAVLIRPTRCAAASETPPPSSARLVVPGPAGPLCALSLRLPSLGWRAPLCGLSACCADCADRHHLQVSATFPLFTPCATAATQRAMETKRDFGQHQKRACCLWTECSKEMLA